MKFSLGKKITLFIVVISIVLSGCAVWLGYRTFVDTLDGYYKTMAYNLVKTAASQIDQENIDGYLQTLTPDAAYEKQFQVLSDIRENNDILYLYIVKPMETGAYYILDTDPTESAVPLGYFEEYYEGIFKDSTELFLRGEEVEPIISKSDFGWLLSVFYPLKHADGTMSGYVSADISMDKVKSEQAAFLQRMIALLAIATLLLTLIILYLLRQNVIAPINRLSKAASDFVSDTGEEKLSTLSTLNIRTGDEIQQLSESFQQMEIDIHEYIHNITSITKEKERIGAELNVATQIQASMLPNIFPPFPDRTEFDIFATMNPAKEVGGDFYDFFMVDEKHLAFVVADVSGKGVPAALFMVISKTLIKNWVQTGQTPAEVFTSVNEQLCENNDVGMFVTAWLGIMNIDTGHIAYANAGHNHPLILRKDGNVEWIAGRPGFVLGGMEGMRYQQFETHLAPGDMLYLYTDGVTEALDTKEELFGDDRLMDAAKVNAGPQQSPKPFLLEVKDVLDTFSRGAEQADDITMLGLMRNEVADAQPTLDWNARTLPASVDALDEATGFVLSQAGDVSMKTEMKISVVIEELFVNVASYAYGGGQGNVEIATALHDGLLHIRMTDAGVPYDPLAKADPDITLAAEDRSIGGLGIYMVKQNVEDIAYTYADGKNILQFSMRL